MSVISVSQAAVLVAGRAWRHPLAAIAGRAAAVPGAAFTAICLATGSIWARPTWGTWWVWDARLTSELILLFLYVGFLSLTAAIEVVPLMVESAEVSVTVWVDCEPEVTVLPSASWMVAIG
mgnify:CR=1 FL=1